MRVATISFRKMGLGIMFFMVLVWLFLPNVERRAVIYKRTILPLSASIMVPSVYAKTSTS